MSEQIGGARPPASAASTPRRAGGGEDLLAVAKGACGMLVAAAALAVLNLPVAWAVVAGVAVLAVEKRNHAAGRRELPSTVALGVASLVVIAALTLIVIAD